MHYEILLLAVLFSSVQVDSALVGSRIAPANQGLLKLFDKTCENLYGILAYQREFKSISVISTQPVRVRVEMEMTSPTGAKETFTTEAVGQTICRAYGDKTYVGAFQNVAWHPRPGVKEDQCYFHYKDESILIPCTFVLENLQCTDGERDLTKCVRSTSTLFQHSCSSDMHVSVTCSNSVILPITTPSPAGPAKTAPLLIDDTYVDANNVLANYIRASNMTVTVMHGGIENYTGVPDAKAFDVVILIVGKWFVVDMPAAGQQAVLNAQQSGTGVVLTEWASWRVHQYNQWHVLAPLCLTYPYGMAFVPHITFTNLIQDHPIWNALPETFTSVIPIATGTNYIHGSNTMIVAKCESCGGTRLGVVIEDLSHQGKGRIVQINHAAHAHGPSWGIDRNVTQLMVNSVNWAAKSI